MCYGISAVRRTICGDASRDDILWGLSNTSQELTAKSQQLTDTTLALRLNTIVRPYKYWCYSV